MIVQTIVVRWPIGVVPVFANPSRSVRLRLAPPLIQQSGFSFDLKLLHAHYCSGSAE